MTGDPLDRIEARLKACQDDVGNRPYSAPVATGWYAEDVLALVQVARAARELGHHRQGEELRAALARLEGTPE